MITWYKRPPYFIKIFLTGISIIAPEFLLSHIIILNNSFLQFSSHVYSGDLFYVFFYQIIHQGRESSNVNKVALVLLVMQ